MCSGIVAFGFNLVIPFEGLKQFADCFGGSNLSIGKAGNLLLFVLVRCLNSAVGGENVVKP
jgi:hypothetical protein